MVGVKLLDVSKYKQKFISIIVYYIALCIVYRIIKIICLKYLIMEREIIVKQNLKYTFFLVNFLRYKRRDHESFMSPGVYAFISELNRNAILIQRQGATNSYNLLHVTEQKCT